MQATTNSPSESGLIKPKNHKPTTIAMPKNAAELRLELELELELDLEVELLGR